MFSDRNSSNKLVLEDLLYAASPKQNNLYYSFSFRKSDWIYDDERSFIEAGFCSRSFTVELSDSDLEYKIRGNNDLLVKSNTFFVNYGYNYIHKGKISLVHEIYFGLGFNFVSFDTFTVEHENNLYSMPDIFYEKQNTRERQNNFRYLMGYSIGIAF